MHGARIATWCAHEIIQQRTVKPSLAGPLCNACKCKVAFFSHSLSICLQMVRKSRTVPMLQSGPIQHVANTANFLHDAKHDIILNGKHWFVASRKVEVKRCKGTMQQRSRTTLSQCCPQHWLHDSACFRACELYMSTKNG